MVFGGDVIGRAKIIVESQIDQSSLGKTGSKFGSVLKKTALVGVASFGLVAAAGIKASFAAEEAASVQNKLNNVLSNMGKTGAVDAVNELASAQMKLTGVDDEVIKKGQTILGTFSNIAKTAGETGGAFERATKLSLDLAATGFSSVDGAAKMLGKALQDPTKGVTALGRAGVTFSEVQKEQIKNFIKTGQVAKAQDLILKEVEKQVGGTAAAGAKSSDKLKTAFGELEESFGGLLISLFDTGGKEDGITKLTDAIYDLADGIDRFKESEGLKNFKELIATLSDTGWVENQNKNNKQALQMLDDTLAFLNNQKPTKGGVMVEDFNPQKGWDQILVAFDTFQTTIRTKFANLVTDVTAEGNNLRDSVVRSFSDAQTGARTQFGLLVDNATKKGQELRTQMSQKFEQVKTDITTKVNGWKTSAVSALKDLPGKMRTAGSQAIQGFLDGLSDFGEAAAGVGSRIAKAIRDAINSALPDSLSFGGGSVAGVSIPKVTINIPKLAKGTTNFAGGLALVGEKGPELVNLPRGAGVTNARDTAAMLAGGRNVSIVQNNFGAMSGGDRNQELLWLFRYAPIYGQAG